MSGTILAQIISFATFTYLIRQYYSPSDLSNFMWFFEFVSIFAAIGALRLETAIILERDNNLAYHLIKLCIKFLFLFSLIGGVIALIGIFINQSFKIVLDSPLLLITVPIAIFSLGMVQIFTSWFTREQKFKTIASNKIIQNSGSALGQFTFAISKFTSAGLILGKVFGSIVAALLLFKQYYSSKPKLDKSIAVNNRSLIQKNKDFILYSTPGTLIGTFINFLLIHLFLTYYSEDISGEIGAAKYYLGIGFSIISSAFAQVFFSNIAKINDKQQLKKYYTYWLLRLIGIAGLVLITLHLVPNSLIVAVLGSKWTNLLPTVRIMSIWMSIMFVSSSLSYIYIKVNQQRTLIFFDIIHLLFIWLSIFISYRLYADAETSLIWFTVTQSLYYIIAIVAAYYFIERFKPAEN